MQLVTLFIPKSSILTGKWGMVSVWNILYFYSGKLLLGEKKCSIQIQQWDIWRKSNRECNEICVVAQERVKKSWIIHVYSHSANSSFLMDCARGASPCSIPTVPSSSASHFSTQLRWRAPPESQTRPAALISPLQSDIMMVCGLGWT